MKLGLREANQHVSKAIKAVRAGKEVILTERAIRRRTPPSSRRRSAVPKSSGSGRNCAEANARAREEAMDRPPPATVRVENRKLRARHARVDSSPAIAGGRVFVGSNDGRVYGLDLANGKKVWE